MYVYQSSEFEAKAQNARRIAIGFSALSKIWKQPKR